MDPHDPDMFPDRIAIVDPIDDTDEDAGATEEVAIPTAFPLTCYIVTTDTRLVSTGNNISEEGLTDARIFFPTRPSPEIKRGDRIFRQGDLREFRAKGPVEPRGGNLHLVNAASSG